MSYRYEKNPDNGEQELVISGWETGIASSPHAGLGNLQGVNTLTEIGEVMCTYNRVQQSQVAGSGTLTQVNTNTVSVSGIVLRVGTWIHITNGGTTGLSGDYYYVSSGKLSATFAQDNSTIVTGITAGSATFTVYAMGKPLESAYERYTDVNGVVQYRYYILDDLAQVWVHDTFTLTGVDTPLWFTGQVPFALNGRTPSGLSVYNGWMSICLDYTVYWVFTSYLGAPFYAVGGIQLTSKKNHKSLYGHQGKLYWCDGTFIASLFANSSTLSGGANIQSYAKYTASTITGTLAPLIAGAQPDLTTVGLRVPAVFITPGTLPTALTLDTNNSGSVKTSIVYYIGWLSSGQTFAVYAAVTGGAALDIQTGSSGPQYFDTFCPLSADTTTKQLYTFSPQRLNLPFYERAQCMAELGNTVVVGGATNTLYPWDQVSALPGTIIPLPENNTVNLVTVNSIAYVFTGQKGNIYITNGSSASFALSVPDYCAGIAGTPATYIEPYFSWGDAMFSRGRVWFSILDQTATKAGNCGGIWSFLPVQSGASTQEVGKSLRLENQNSYGSYNGVASVLIASQDQNFIGPQYWSGWYSSVSNPLYGIDFSDTIPTLPAVIESDLIPTGTFINKKTFKQIEYKLAAPLANGETVAVSYRVNGTDSFTSTGTMIVESTTGLSGYVPVNFEKTQWLQLKITLTPLASSASSFVRLREVRVR